MPCIPKVNFKIYLKKIIPEFIRTWKTAAEATRGLPEEKTRHADGYKEGVEK